jgi:hypothetical protein
MTQFINERHRWLELMASKKGYKFQKCYCGDHLDEKREIMNFRRQVLNGKREGMTPIERFTKDFATMTENDRKELIKSLTGEG